MSREPGQYYWSLVEPVWIPLNRSWEKGSEAFLRRFLAVEPKVGHLYAAHWCQSEVCNGGFHQFFWNTTGLLGPEALCAFRAIGLSEWSHLLGEGMGFFGRRYPRERAQRQKVLPDPGCQRGKPSPFEAIDERFFAWLHVEPDRWEVAADNYARAEAHGR